MNRRQKIIVTITGIFIVLLALVGLTYAYFLTRIRGNENEKSLSVTTANLELVYGDGNNLVTASNIEPGWTTDGKDGRPNAKIFTVTNNGNAPVEDFNIYLENVINQISRKSDLVYTITCENTTVGATSTECEEFEVVENEVNGTELVFPSVMSIIARDTLDPATETTNAEQHTYTITVRYKEMNVDQSEDMNKEVSAKVNIYDSKTKFLATEIMTNVSENATRYIEPSILGTAENTTIPGKAVSLENEKVLSYTFDDYGTSYYFRGSVEDNYVNFAGMCWRIVRIEGDGSIKLVLASKNGTCDTEGAVTSGSGLIGAGVYGTQIEYKIDEYNLQQESKYLISYDNAHETNNMKAAFDAFLNGGNYTGTNSYTHNYKGFSDSDKSKLKEETVCIGNTDEVYNRSGILLETEASKQEIIDNTVDYTPALFSKNYIRLVNSKIVSQKCDADAIKTQPNKIFPLTVDEVIYAGGLINEENSSYYMIENSIGTDIWAEISNSNFTNQNYGWLTASIASKLKFKDMNEINVVLHDSPFQVSSNIRTNQSANDPFHELRPAISLKYNSTITTKSDITTYGLPGTQNNPYVIN